MRSWCLQKMVLHLSLKIFCPSRRHCQFIVPSPLLMAAKGGSAVGLITLSANDGSSLAAHCVFTECMCFKRSRRNCALPRLFTKSCIHSVYVLTLSRPGTSTELRRTSVWITLQSDHAIREAFCHRSKISRSVP